MIIKAAREFVHWIQRVRKLRSNFRERKYLEYNAARLGAEEYSIRLARLDSEYFELVKEQTECD